MSDYRTHNELVNKVLLYLHSTYRGRYWGNATGAVKTDNDHFQRYGLKGSADILGISGDGKFVAVEVKTGAGRLSGQQNLFKDSILKNLGIFILVKNEIIDDDFKQLIRREL